MLILQEMNLAIIILATNIDNLISVAKFAPYEAAATILALSNTR